MTRPELVVLQVCECTCADLGHDDCTGTAEVGAVVLRGGQRISLGLCSPCATELRRLLPADAIRRMS